VLLAIKFVLFLSAVGTWGLLIAVGIEKQRVVDEYNRFFGE